MRAARALDTCQFAGEVADGQATWRQTCGGFSFDMADAKVSRPRVATDSAILVEKEMGNGMTGTGGAPQVSSTLPRQIERGLTVRIGPGDRRRSLVSEVARPCEKLPYVFQGVPPDHSCRRWAARPRAQASSCNVHSCLSPLAASEDRNEYFAAYRLTRMRSMALAASRGGLRVGGLPGAPWRPGGGGVSGVAGLAV
jgi:hypothetical protein